MNKTPKDILHNYQLRVTTTRQEILALFIACDHAIGKSDIESSLKEIDRITLYRTLKTFEQKGIIHKAEDGSKNSKYALCPSIRSKKTGCSHNHNDKHAHFHCLVCEQTVCLTEVTLPKIDLPVGYRLEDSQIILKGVCNKCS
ncbi:MAG: transcriptional repressor [Bacteroidota bacterium]